MFPTYLTAHYLTSVLLPRSVSSPLKQDPTSQMQQPVAQQQKRRQQAHTPKGAAKCREMLLLIFVLFEITASIGIFLHLKDGVILWREETLANICDKHARMLEYKFSVSMSHFYSLAILVSTYHPGKHPSAIDQKTFDAYTERTAFERPLTNNVAYALKVPHSERELFEKKHGWTIKTMDMEKLDPAPMDPAPIHDEYAPVIFSQETISHIVSVDVMSFKEDRESILQARATGKGVLTSPFMLLKSNHLAVVLTFAVYNTDLPPYATPEQRIEATVGYLGAMYDVAYLMEKLLYQLSSKQMIVVNVYDTTNASSPISMYATEVIDTGFLKTINLDFGDPFRKYEMHCRFKQKPPLPWMAIKTSVGLLVITLLAGYILYAAMDRIAKVEEDCCMMTKLKARAEAADVAKSQFLTAVSHKIRTLMNGVLGQLRMLMDTDLDANQLDHAQTARACVKDLKPLINEVQNQAIMYNQVGS